MGEADEADEIGGRVLAGRYRLRAPLAKGGMGEVWEAYDERLAGRRVVVKLMLDGGSGAGATAAEDLRVRRERFLREVRTTAAIEHLGVPAVFDADIDARTGRPYIALQMLHGRELQTLIDETDHAAEPLDVARAAAIGAQIASVLDEVHRHDVVHRDIKPANLMLTPGGIVKVLDFGVAALLGSGAHPRLTRFGTTVGTPPYMSPEQALGNTVGPTSDVYALACVLYAVLTGRPPFRETAGRSYQWHHVHAEPEPITSARPDVPDEIESLLLDMLRKEPEDRPQAAEVYERLLPSASRPAAPGFPADIAELDPCLPFVRPLGGRVRRRRTASPAPPSGTAAPGPAITEDEVTEIGERAQRLIDAGLSVEALDLLETALARAQDPRLIYELSHMLAMARYFAGAYREAAALFADLGSLAVVRYGPDDPDVPLARYYVAKCRDELGDINGAVEAFTDVAEVTFDPSDEKAADRHLDALSSLMRLYAVTRRPDRLHRTAERLREAIRLYRPDDAEAMLAELEAYLARLTRWLDGGTT